MPPRSRRRPIRFGIVIALVFGLLFTSPPPAPIDPIRFPTIDWSRPLDVLAAPARFAAAGAQAAGRWLLGGVGPGPAAAAELQDPADDGPASRTEVSSGRSRDAKLYREPSGSYTAEFGHGLHYQAAPGDWREVDLDFRRDGNEWVADKNEVIVRVTSTGVKITDRDTGKGVTWKTPVAASVSGRKATFTGPDGLSFTYSNTPDGLKLEAVVSRSIGAKTFAFDYTLQGGAAPFTVDPQGNLRSDSFVVPRALATGANEQTYVAGVWRIAGTKVAFDFDDTAFPSEAYPYTLDPSTTFGQDSNGDDGHVYKISSSYPPGGSVSVDTASTRINVSRKRSAGDYTVRNGFGRWPTGSLPNAASIEGATLRLQLTYHQADDDKALMAEWYPASNWPLDSADYSAGALWSASGSVGWDIGTLANGEIDLSLEGYASGVSTTGDTGLRFHVQSGQPTGVNEVHFKAREDPDTGSAAKLIVVYETAPSVPTNLSPSDPTTSADSTPTLQGTYSDPDPGDDGYLVFEIKEGSTVAWTNEGDPDNTAAASGQISARTVPAGILADGVTYTWRARAWDGEQASSWSAARSFTLDTSSLTGALTAPENGDTLTGTTTLSAQPNQGASVGAVRFYAISQGRKRLVGTDTTESNGTYSVSFDTTLIPDGRANIRAEFASGADDLAYCCSPGAGASVTIENGDPAPTDWQATVEPPGLAPTEDTDGQVVLSNGALVLGTLDTDMPGKGFSPSFERAYNSATQAGGILGPGWRTNLEDAVVPKVSGDVVHTDGAGRERTFTATFAGGLNAKYWNNNTLTGTPALERTEANIDFDWGNRSPDGAVTADGFSSRWEGYLDATATGTWTFSVTAGVGARLFIDGNRVIEKWPTPFTEVSASIRLTQGKHEIRMDHYDAPGLSPASAVLSWSGPGVAKQVIPPARFSRVTGYQASAGSYDTLTRNSDGSFAITDTEQIVAHYTAAGQRDTVSDPRGFSLQTAYDAKDRPQYLCADEPTCDGASDAIKLTYTSSDLLDTVTDDAGRTWSFAYTSGRLTSVTGPEGEVTAYRYDAAGRLDRITDAEGGITEITYTSGKITAVKDPVAVAGNGSATTFAYDSPAPGKVTVRSSEANEDNAPGTIHELGSGGEARAVTDPLGNTTSFDYDANFNLTKETDPLGDFTTYEYDANGNLRFERIFDGDAPATPLSTVEYQFDDKNNLIKEIDPTGIITEFHFDAAGVHLREEIDAVGTTVEAKTTYDYYTSGPSAGLLKTVTDPRGNAPGADPAEFTTIYEYDGDGNRTAEIGPEGARTDFVYNAAGDLTRETVKIDATTSATTAYDYDDHGNVVEERDPEQFLDPDKGKTVYEYDLLGRQTKVVDPVGYTPGKDPTDYDSFTRYDKLGRVKEEEDALGKIAS